MLAPEYGGDGKQVGECAEKLGPAAAYPGPLGADALAFYNGTQFPETYRGGAFIALPRLVEPGARAASRGTTSSSSRSRAASRRATTRSSPTGSPDRRSSPATARHRPSGAGGRTRRCALHQRRQRRADLEDGARRELSRTAPARLTGTWPAVVPVGTAGASDLDPERAHRPSDMLRLSVYPAPSAFRRPRLRHNLPVSLTNCTQDCCIFCSFWMTWRLRNPGPGSTIS